MTDDMKISFPLGNGLVAVLKIDNGSLTPMAGDPDCPSESTCVVILADVEKPPPRKVTKIELKGPVKGMENGSHELNLHITLDLEQSPPGPG